MESFTLNRLIEMYCLAKIKYDAIADRPPKEVAFSENENQQLSGLKQLMDYYQSEIMQILFYEHAPKIKEQIKTKHL